MAYHEISTFCPKYDTKQEKYDACAKKILSYKAIIAWILKTYTKSENYDLMEVVILNLGDADMRSDSEILNLLNVLFSTGTTPEEKKQRLQNEFDIAMTVELKREVQEMSNFSKALIKRGIEQGIEQGREQGIEQGKEQSRLSLAQLMIKENEPVDKIERYTGYTQEKIEEIANTL